MKGALRTIVWILGFISTLISVTLTIFALYYLCAWLVCLDEFVMNVPEWVSNIPWWLTLIIGVYGVLGSFSGFFISDAVSEHAIQQEMSITLIICNLLFNLPLSIITAPLAISIRYLGWDYCDD